MENEEDQIIKTERDFKGVWIPREIYLNKNLLLNEKILLIEINSLDKGEGCFASNKYLANFLDMSESRVAGIISKLRKTGLIIDRKFNGRIRYISVDFEKAGLLQTAKQVYYEQQGRVVTDNNIVIQNNNTGYNTGKGKSKLSPKKLSEKDKSRIEYLFEKVSDRSITKANLMAMARDRGIDRVDQVVSEVVADKRGGNFKNIGAIITNRLKAKR